ncbi:MAG: hypothetical protein JSS82_13880, partial [Bacteroidetes bacterium]|nr:hypothetical protein [Bacteroidota bacterium]
MSDFMRGPNAEREKNPAFAACFEDSTKNPDLPSSYMFSRSTEPQNPTDRLTPSDLMDIETSAHLEAANTPSQTWVASMSKVKLKKVRHDVTKSQDHLRIPVVRVNEDFGKPKNANVPAKDILQQSSSYSTSGSHSTHTAANDSDTIQQLLSRGAAEPSAVGGNAISVNEAVGNEPCPKDPLSKHPVGSILHHSTAGFISQPKDVTCTGSGALTVSGSEGGGRKSAIMTRTVAAMQNVPLYTLSVTPEDRRRVQDELFERNKPITREVNLRLLEHQTAIANGQPFVPNISSSILQNQEVIPFTMIVPLEVVRSFLRKNSPKEKACIAGPNCYGMQYVRSTERFPLVSFYL